MLFIYIIYFLARVLDKLWGTVLNYFFLKNQSIEFLLFIVKLYMLYISKTEIMYKAKIFENIL